MKSLSFLLVGRGQASRAGVSRSNSSGEWDIGSVPSGLSRWAGLAVVENLQVKCVFDITSWAAYAWFWSWMLACLSAGDIFLSALSILITYNTVKLYCLCLIHVVHGNSTG